jgi:predicted dehydrogenase
MIRIATIGTSTITRQFIRAARDVRGITLAGVYSRTAATAASAAVELDAPRWWCDLSELLADSAVDAVYIASPNGAHLAQSLAAVAAGKHVLVEKPAVPSAAEFESLVAAAASHGVVVLEGMRNAYDPGTSAVRSLLPRLGAIRRASFSYSQRSARYDQVLAGQQVNIFDPRLAGGALLDLGVYCASMMVDLFGAPTRVLGSTVTVGSGVDGAGAALAEYPGYVVDLSWSKITASARPNEIQGERASLEIDHVAAPRTLRLRFVDGSTENHALDLSPANLTHEIERFVDVVAGADGTSDQHRTLQTLRVVDAIRGDTGTS